jgi:hypothetical protein
MHLRSIKTIVYKLPCVFVSTSIIVTNLLTLHLFHLFSCQSHYKFKLTWYAPLFSPFPPSLPPRGSRAPSREPAFRGFRKREGFRGDK